jgi:hypothetical protein
MSQKFTIGEGGELLDTDTNGQAFFQVKYILKKQTCTTTRLKNMA